jgi:hypothetical protein
MTSPAPDEEQSLEAIRRDEEEATRPAEMYYPNVVEFVTDRLVHLVQKPTPESGRVWCPEWYRHASALSRLDGIWRAWEFLRFDPGLGMSTWWVHHVDPNLAALMDPATGPFARCGDGHDADGNQPLPHVPAPEGVFTDQRFTGPLPANPLSLDSQSS